jgi:ubiquinone/menaquinone biosynthesis C-methylase UbiE
MEKNWTQTRQPTFNRDGALKMNDIAKTVFAPIYPVIARNALAATGIDRGICLDLGTGPGMLAMAMARETPQMEVIAFDFSTDSLQIAEDNIAEARLTRRIRTRAGDVHAMPFADNYADLIVSRGSMFFWKDLQEAFKEIHRVLAPGGATYIGGGFGSLELKEQVIAEFAEMFAELGCQDSYRIIDDETGFWVVLTK